jgi:hypothetical protein
MSKYIMELNGKAIQMSNVQWAKVCVKGIVQQAVVDGEVDGRLCLR